ncbi:hypothetical protein HJC23_008643 [Cyclotella cryptica]|uniref:Uncharacterized protein n=1 Tax=Cyclotella cryptica TaxID=29204 RepID=A0ABD3P8D7_9STRA
MPNSNDDNNNDDGNNNWFSTRKRKLPLPTADAPANQSTSPLTSASKPTAESLPPSSTPHLPLDWTKLSSCHRKKPRSLRPADTSERNLEYVSGRAIFFLPRPNSDLDSNDDEHDNDDTNDDNVNHLTWFQGRFFPTTTKNHNNHNNNHLPMQNHSPRSIVTPTQNSTLSSLHTPTPPSWGILGIQTLVLDECLRCSEGGYRQVDLTFLRYLSSPSSSTSSSACGRKKTKQQTSAILRWKVHGVTWTGGDMMRLWSTVPRPPPPPATTTAALGEEETGVQFDPVTMVGGDKAMWMAEKYFPALVKQMRGEGGGEEDDDVDDALIIIGNMELVVPKSFVEKRRMNDARGNVMEEDDNDGLWSD